MAEVNRKCGAQYERPGGRERDDRIVRCDLRIGHEGPHEETETGSRWVGASSAADLLAAAAGRGRPSSWDLIQGPAGPEAPTQTGGLAGEAVSVDD